jgi:hypothetical protein
MIGEWVSVWVSDWVSECEEVVVLQVQRSTELSEMKLFQYRRYKIEECKWWHKNWGLIAQIGRTVEPLQNILDVVLNLFRNFKD